MWVVALRRSGTSSDGCLALSMATSMVIFVVPRRTPGDRPRVTIAASRSGMGGLDELHAARNSQDASSHGSESEAWIDGEEGSIDVH